MALVISRAANNFVLFPLVFFVFFFLKYGFEFERCTVP